MYPLVIAAKRKNQWKTYGYLIQEKNNKFLVIDIDNFHADTDFENLLNQCYEYNYIEEIDISKTFLTINYSIKKLNENYQVDFYFKINYKEMFLNVEYFPELKFDRNIESFTRLLFVGIEKNIIEEFIEEFKNSTLKNKQDIFKKYEELEKKYNFEISKDGFFEGLIISSK